MPSVILRKYTLPQEASNIDQLNRISPLSYQEWLTNNIGIIPNQAEQQYNLYLTSFYTTKTNNLGSSSDKIKEDYIALLKRLQVIFKDDLEFNRIANIDFNNTTELKIAIPYFARKLKEIALYYVSKRDALKKTKLKYNMVGSVDAVEKILYEYLLQAFTKKENTIQVQDKQLFNNIPDLSAINNGFSIKVEELYDTTNYFDKQYSETNNSTGIYPLSTNNPLLFILEDYIYNLYNALSINDVPLSGLSNPLNQFVLCEMGDELNVQLNALIDSKYISNNLYYLTGGYFDFDDRDVSLDLKTGNNFFYWFSGEYIREIPDGVFANKPISAIDWTNATGSNDISGSDIVFISVGNKLIEGAWLSDTLNITVTDTMSASIQNDTMFKFPYAGIGVSAENISWSGPTLENIKEFNTEFFPSDKSFIDNQEQIKNLYWSNYDSISSARPITLNDTTLGDCGAFASNTFNKADKILVRRNTGADGVHDTAPNQVYNGTFDVAWLYNFDKTQLCIIAGNNNIYYPLSSYSDPSQLSFVYDSGDDVALSSINIGSSFAGAVAGDSISNSDMLIKLDSICGSPVEAAWLKGTPLSSFNSDKNDPCSCSGDYSSYYTNWKYSKGVTQPSLNFNALAGEFVRFIWTGPTVDINDIKGFGGFDHDESCPYAQDPVFVSLIDNSFVDFKNGINKFEKWKKCTCRAVSYSPLGHNKTIINAYPEIPDFIAKDTNFPNPFNFNLWTGTDGRNFKTSADVAWFKVANLIEPDLGWGKGNWQSNIDAPFVLVTGTTYIYYRSNLNRCNFSLPSLIVNNGYCECEINNCNKITCVPTWQKAVMDNRGVWIDAGLITDMMLESNTFFKYTHQPAISFSKNILTYNGNIINSVSGDFVTLSAIDPHINYLDSPVSHPSINFLIKIPLANNNPYWATASFEANLNTSNKLKMYGASEFRTECEYLLVTQPDISNITLKNNDVLQFKMSNCNNCFIWTQPMTFDIIDHQRQWNKILTNSCVKSELLNYLQDTQCDPCNISSNGCYSECQVLDICGCTNLCYPSKVGLTASNIKSDLIFNTELSGIPMFVDYYARNEFTVNFKVVDISNGVPPYGGLWVPPVSTIYINAELPWRNIINDMYPIVASEQSTNLSAIYDLGIFIPDKLFNGKYELRKAIFDLDYLERDVTSNDIIRSGTYADGPIGVESTQSSWMKQLGNNTYSGNVKIDKHQTYYPYTTKFETTNHNNLGLYDLNSSNFSPWDKNGQWSDEFNYPANFRGQHAISCGPNAWYNNQLNLTQNVISWNNDIFGNQYFVLSLSSTRLDPEKSYSSIYVKDGSGILSPATTSFQNIFNKYLHIYA